MSPVLSVYAFLAAAVVAQPPVSALTPDQFLKKLDAATEQVTSYDIGIRFEGREFTYDPEGRPTETQVQSYQRQAYEASRARRRIDIFELKDGKKKQLISSSVVDGESYRSYNRTNNEGSIDVPPPIPVVAGLDYLGFYRNAVGVYSFSAVLRGRTTGAKVDRDPKNPALLRLSVEPVRTPASNLMTDKLGFEISVDPDKNFFPVSIRATTVRKDGKIVPQRETRIEAFYPSGDGLFVPQKVVTDYFNVDAPPAGRVFNTLVVEIDVANSRWNEPLPESTFQLGFPVGSRVTDMHRKVQFVSGTDDPSKTVKELADAAVDSAPLGAARQVIPFVPTPWWKDWRRLTGLAAVLILAVALTYTRYRRRKEAVGA